MGHFTKTELDQSFVNDISIEPDMEEPLSYYPFSETDDRGLIVKEVLRAIITILRDKRRRGLDVFDRATYRNDEILRTVHQMYDALSVDHREVLMDKAFGIIDHLRIKYTDFYSQVLKLQEKDSNSDVALSNLIDLCEKIVENEENGLRLDNE